MKKVITYILFTALLVCMAGCGSKPGNTGASIESIPTVDSTENVTSVNGNDTQATIDTDTQTSIESTGVLSEKETTLAHFEAFLDSREECVYDGQKFYMNDMLIYLKDILTENFSLNMIVQSAMYGYMDAGVDGIPELAVSVSYVDEYDDSGMGPCVRVFLIRYDGDELSVFGEEQSYYRSQTDIMYNGYVVSGGSNGAASYDWDRYFYNAEGKKVYLVHENYEFVENEPYISYFEISDEVRPDNYPMFQWETESGLMFPDYAVEGSSFIINTINFGEYNYDEGIYDDYIKDNIFFVSDENGEDTDIPAAYLSYYEGMGLKVYDVSKYPGMLENHIKELGYDANIIYGDSYIEWNTISLG